MKIDGYMSFFKMVVLSGGIMAALLLGGASLKAEEHPQSFTDGQGIEFVLIPAGSFNMGSPGINTDDPFTKAKPEPTSYDERPVHKVTISRPFYMGKFEVTQEQWHAIMGSNPAKFKGRTNPVEGVSWNEVQIFIQKLNEKEGHNRYRLPTEAEWEYAARAGSDTTYFFGDGPGLLQQYAWYGEFIMSGSTHPVGGKKPNPWGLYDIYGNVGEWVQDWWGPYPEGSVSDPQGPEKGIDYNHVASNNTPIYQWKVEKCVLGKKRCEAKETGYKVFRGGNWSLNANSVRSAARHIQQASGRVGPYTGFRLVLALEDKEKDPTHQAAQKSALK